MTASVVGIDLGTTNSCVAVYRSEFSKVEVRNVEIIYNEEGSRTTPSCVAFTDTERLIGDAAKSQDTFNPTNTIFGAKRLIGRKFSDPFVQADMKLLPYKVINVNGNPKITVQYKGEEKIYCPEEISAMVLGKMKEIAEKYLGAKVDKAVITVPARFNDSQRQATKDAGDIAGLKVLRIINEPTAAALAYGLVENQVEERNVLIYDLGGGTCDVSILNIEENIFEVKSTTGNTHLGGEDFDNRMVKYCLDEINTKHDKDLSNDKFALRRLRSACERAKKILSNALQANIDLDLLFDNISFQKTITRTLFEELNMDLFEKTIELVDEAIKDANLTKNDIHDIILVGGSSRIPIVCSLLKKHFEGKKFVHSVNPDEAVAIGAAIQAAMLDKPDSNDKLLTDVTPFSLGVNKSGGFMDVLIPRNSPIPLEKTKTYYTVTDSQPCVNIEVYEGENVMTCANKRLGRFKLDDIPLLPKGEARIKVSFKIDANSILNVTAIEATTQKSRSINITCNKGRLSKEEINKMKKEAEKYRKDDAERKRTIEMKNKLEKYCYSIKRKVEDTEVAKKIKHIDEQSILKMIKETLIWIGVTNNSKDDFERRLNELQEYCDPILKSVQE